MEKKYNYLYKITNLINGKFYYGIHSTDNLNDGYMGSGTCLHEAYNKYGIENFQKEILEFRDTRKEIFDLEKEIVNNELVKNHKCYNITIGGKGLSLGFFIAYDKIEKINKQITQKDFDTNPDRYQGCSSGKVPVLIDGEYKHISCEEYSKGEYQTVWSGKHHSEETKQKMSDSAKERKGEKNSQYGTCWIIKNNEIKKIKKEELDNYLCDGWKKGRTNKIKTCWIIKNNEIKKIKKEELNNYLNDGWKKYKYRNSPISNKLNINDIINDTKNGLTCYEISEKYNISISTLRRFMSKNNIINLNNQQKGENHPQFGKCWIYNNIENKYIKKSELDNYLNDGWIKGRKMK